MKWIKRLAIAALIGLLLLTAYHQTKSYLDKKDLRSEESYVLVDNHRFYYKQLGQGDELMVILPGYGSPLPSIDYKPLAKELAKDYEVIIFEPLGYGVSDIVYEERNARHYTKELHEVLKELGVDQPFYLLGHSMGGLYGLHYSATYPEQVKGYVGLDAAIPGQDLPDQGPLWLQRILAKIGGYRLLGSLSPQLVTPDDFSTIYGEEDRELLHRIALSNLFNDALLQEMKGLSVSFQAVKEASLPPDLPVLFVLATETQEETPSWRPLHEAYLFDHSPGQIKMISGDHFFYRTRPKETVDLINAFLKK